jgi:hypothetical protein
MESNGQVWSGRAHQIVRQDTLNMQFSNAVWAVPSTGLPRGDLPARNPRSGWCTHATRTKDDWHEQMSHGSIKALRVLEMRNQRLSFGISPPCIGIYHRHGIVRHSLESPCGTREAIGCSGLPRGSFSRWLIRSRTGPARVVPDGGIRSEVSDSLLPPEHRPSLHDLGHHLVPLGCLVCP